MPKFLIERDVPGAGSMSANDWRGPAKTSCSVLAEMGPQIQWLQSYVTGDRVYCIYIAPDEDTIRTHARQAGLPANRISRITNTLDPTTAE